MTKPPSKSRKRPLGPSQYVLAKAPTKAALRIRYNGCEPFPWLLELAYPDKTKGLAIASFETEQKAEAGHRLLSDALLHLEEFL